VAQIASLALPAWHLTKSILISLLKPIKPKKNDDIHGWKRNNSICGITNSWKKYNKINLHGE
jgi:hypothetical protein